MKIIPAIDIIDGKCVRLKKGDYSQKKIYSDNPLEIAKSFFPNGKECKLANGVLDKLATQILST